MKRLTVQELDGVLGRAIRGSEAPTELRRFVFLRHESDDEIELEPALADVLAVLEPYIEYEEASGDPIARVRLERVHRVLRGASASRERVVFALEYDAIVELARRFDRGDITRTVFEQQISALSPAPFDRRRVCLWARAHLGAAELDPKRMA